MRSTLLKNHQIPEANSLFVSGLCKHEQPFFWAYNICTYIICGSTESGHICKRLIVNIGTNFAEPTGTIIRIPMINLGRMNEETEIDHGLNDRWTIGVALTQMCRQ